MDSVPPGAQIDRLISLGFHKQLGLLPDDYRKRFPKVPPGPRQGFNLLVVIEGHPLIDLRFQHRAVGIVECRRCGELSTDGLQLHTPYFIWTHDGTRYRTTTIGGAVEAFAASEMACSQLEVSSLFIQYPELFRGRGIDSGRTHNAAGYYSTLLWVDERPELALHHYNDFTPGLSVLSRHKLDEES